MIDPKADDSAVCYKCKWDVDSNIAVITVYPVSWSLWFMPCEYVRELILYKLYKVSFTNYIYPYTIMFYG